MAMATLVCRNGFFIWPPQLSPYPGHLQNLLFPQSLEKKPHHFHGHLSFHFPRIHHDRRSATVSAQSAFLEYDEEEKLIGLPSLPHNANSSLSIESWGRLYMGPFEAKYWNSNREFPYTVGYAAIKTYKGKQFLQKIEEGPDGPLFIVEVIGENKSFSSKSPQKVWNNVVEEDGQHVQGARHFGFQSPDVIKALQSLPKLRNSNHTQEALSEREPGLHVNSLSFVEKGQVSDIIENESDHEFAQVESMFEEDNNDDLIDEEETVREEEEDEDNNVDDGDEDDALVAATEEEEEEDDDDDDDEDNDIDDGDEEDALVAATEEEEEEEEEDDDDDDDVLHDVEDHNADDNHDHDLEGDDDEEEDGNGRDTLSYNVYSNKYKQSFGSTHARSHFDRYERYDSVDEPCKEGIEGASNGIHYSSDRGKLRGSGRIWRKGDSLAGPVGTHGKQQSAERLGADQRYLSSEGTQPRSSAAMGFNGSRSWDSSFIRKREENTKSSQMLLELMQKWNRAKRWTREPVARVRSQVEGKNLWSKENNEQQQDVLQGDERMLMTASGLGFQGHDSGLVPKGKPDLRSYEGREAVRSGGYYLENNESILDEFRISDDVNESTDYAISKLFETVGRKESLFNDFKPLPRLGKLSVIENPRVINHEEKSWSAGSISRPAEVMDYKARSKQSDGVKHIREVYQEAEKGLDSESTGEPMQLVARGVASLPTKQIDKIRLIEDVRKLAGRKQYEDALSTVKRAKVSNVDLQVDVYEALLGDVKLEAWQKQVFKHVQDGNSVLVSAPSGAGKSTVANCCLFRNFIEEHRTLFVTPSEHLANEKVNILGSIFGHRNVGGTMTRMQKDHKVGVITLEMLTKMLKELNGPGGSEFRFFFEGVKMVVLDKFHTFSEATYVNMWEEVFMLMDAKIKVLALTLPANNEEQIVSWIGMNRGPCKLVSSRVQSVSRRYFFCCGSGLFPLLDAKGVQVNDDLIEKSGGYNNTMTKEQIDSFFLSGYDKPSLKLALSLLGDNAMLPALVTLFNIKSCEDAMQDAFAALGEGLLSKLELGKLEVRMDELGESHPDLLKHLEQIDREALHKGFAACHEGKLPAWQTFVLKLFQENIVKVLIVTENMLFHTEVVARTLILPATHKMIKDVVLPIRQVQALPLFGSAGRRGYDIEGNVVFLKNFFSGPSEAASLVLKSDLNIVSAYKPSYSLVVNLMAKYSLRKVKQLLSSTFHDVVYHNTLARDKKLEDADKRILDCLEAKADFEVKLFQGLAQVNKQKLVDAAVFTRVDIRMTIHSASHSGNAFPGFLLAVVPDKLEPFYMVFGADNKFRLVPAGALDHVYTVETPTLDVQYKQATGQPLQPPAIPPKENWTVEHDGTGGYVAHGDLQTRSYAKLLMDYPVQVNVIREGLQPRKEILLLETEISNLIEKRRGLLAGKQFSEAKLALSIEVGNGVKLEENESDTWKEAMRLLKILEQVDALCVTDSQGAHVKLKPLGMLISRLHNVDNELWLALVLSLNNVKQLPPGEFMAIIAATVPLETEVESLFNDQRELLYRSTRPLKEAFAMVEILRKQVAALQGSYTPPLHFSTSFAGMVYAWARGKPGTVGFNLENTNDGEVAWKLRSVIRYANLISRACSQVSVDISEPNDFSSLSMLARRAEEIMSKHFVSVNKNI